MNVTASMIAGIDRLLLTAGHGTRNTFILVHDPDGQLDLTAEAVRTLAATAGPAPTDGVIRIVRTAAAASAEAPHDAPEWFMDYRNADGSCAQMCGNGVRVFAAALADRGLVTERAFPIWTRAGVRTVEILEQPSPSDASAAGDAESGAGTDVSASAEREWQVRVGMGPARLLGRRREVRLAGTWRDAIDADLGNPHTVTLLRAGEDLDALDLSTPPLLSAVPEQGTNVEFVEQIGPRHARMRVFERGVGETLSCGTGAVAAIAVLADALGDHAQQPWRLDVRGGTLSIGWDVSGEMTLAGPAVLQELSTAG